MITISGLIKAIKDERCNPESFKITLNGFTFKIEALPTNQWGDIDDETITRWNGYLDKITNRLAEKGAVYGVVNHDLTWEYYFNSRAKEMSRASHSNHIDQFGCTPYEVTETETTTEKSQAAEVVPPAKKEARKLFTMEEKAAFMYLTDTVRTAIFNYQTKSFYLEKVGATEPNLLVVDDKTLAFDIESMETVVNILKGMR